MLLADIVSDPITLTITLELDSPTTQRVFWAMMEGVIAAVLLIGGGLTTLQTASVSTGLPFAIVLLIGVYSLYIGFSQETYVENAVKRAVDSARDEQLVLDVVTNAAHNDEGGSRR